MKKNFSFSPNSNNNWKNIFLFLIFHWQFLQNGIYCQEVAINSQLCDFSRNTGRRRRRDLLQSGVTLQSNDEFVFYLAIQLFEIFKNSTKEYSCSNEIDTTNQIQNNNEQLMTLRDQITLKEIYNISEIFVDNQQNLNVIFDYIILDDESSTEFETKIYGKIDENINIEISQVCVLQVLGVIVQYESSFDLCSSQGLCDIEVQMEELNNKFNFSSNNKERNQLSSQFNQLANGLSACDVPNSSCRFGCSKPTPQITPPQNSILKYYKVVQQGPQEEEQEAEKIDENQFYNDPLLLLQEDYYYYNEKYYENSNNSNNQSQFSFAPLKFSQRDTNDEQTYKNNNETLIKILQPDIYDGYNQNQNTQDDQMEEIFESPIIENFENETDFFIISEYVYTQNQDGGSRIQVVQPSSNNGNDGDYGCNRKINLMLLVLSMIICSVAVIFSY